MGVTHGNLKAALTSQRGCVKCVPQKPYQPFPEQLRKPGNGGLVMQIQALPSVLVHREVSQDAFWWVDAQFLPYNDAELIVTSTPFIPRQLHTWIPAKKVPQGRIIIYNTAQHPLKGHVLIHTESSVYPKVQPHPMGEAVAYAGKGELKVNNLTNEELYCKGRDLDNRSHRFCAISPNGTKMAVLTHDMGFYYLEIFEMGMYLFTVEKPVVCHKLCPGFVASGTHNDHVECKWSPDGSHLAVSSSCGKLFLVDKALSNKVADIFPDLVKGKLSSAGSFDFDPRVQYSTMAVGSSHGILNLVRIESSVQNIIQHELDTEKTIDCVQYNQDGSSVAVSFRSFQVVVCSSRDLSTLHTIDMSELCSHHISLYQGQPYPTVHRLSFTYDGRHLATSSCDGYIRIWAIPRLLTLQEWCRKSILQNMPIVLVRKCCLPQKVKQFLLSEYF